MQTVDLLLAFLSLNRPLAESLASSSTGIIAIETQDFGTVASADLVTDTVRPESSTFCPARSPPADSLPHSA